MGFFYQYYNDFYSNSDPGNEEMKLDVKIDICDLVKIEDIMIDKKLGPNGALVYCMEILDKNLDWLTQQIDKLEDNCYLLFDFPGQVIDICILITVMLVFISLSVV